MKSQLFTEYVKVKSSAFYSHESKIFLYIEFSDEFQGVDFSSQFRIKSNPQISAYPMVQKFQFSAIFTNAW